MFFSTRNIIFFYITFETTILPVGLIIIFWGSQPERIRALFYMVLYRVIRAFPLIFCLLISPFDRLEFKIFFRTFLIWGLSLTFLVKIPLFGLHLWLPKAHVEAPSLGSIVLAGLLLKLGAWGLINLGEFIRPTKNFLWLISCLGIVRGAIVATIQRDSKRLVAYSSVCHINFIVLIFLFLPPLLKGTRVIIIFAHGITSSFIFWVTGIIFYLKYSRQLIFLGGIISIRSSLLTLTTILFFTNFGVPPSITFFQESSYILFLLRISLPILLIIILYLIIVCYYRLFYLNLFSLNSNRRIKSNLIIETIPIFGGVFSFNVFLLSTII